MVYVLSNLHWFVLFISALVFFHELGHFLVAKACGVKVLKFSLGFGPRLVGFRRGETEYTFALLPFGGFVKMLGELPGDEQALSPEDVPRAFNHKPVWQRAAIVLAGPMFNFALAWVVYFGLFVGPQTFRDTRIGIVTVDEPAWAAGLRPGDKILAIDGEPVSDWNDLREYVGSRPGATLAVAYERGGERRLARVDTMARQEENVFQEAERRGRIGVSVQFLRPVLALVDAESPAARAGLRTGDVVEKVAGTKVESWHEVRNLVAATPQGSPVPLSVRRGEASLELTLSPEAPVAALVGELFSAADTSWGYTGLVNRDSVVAKVDADTPAASAGLLPGDRLIGLSVQRDGRELARPIGVWALDLGLFSGADARSDFTLTYQRGREVRRAVLRLAERDELDELKNTQKTFVFGATNESSMGEYTYERSVGPVEALARGGEQVARDATLIAKGLVKLLSGDIPLASMGGPIMLFVIAEKSAKSGAADFLRTLALISVNLGLINLFPVPVLDGGHLVFLALEAVRRRPPSLRLREVANVVGLVLLLTLMVLAMKNDFFRFVLG